MSYIGNEPPAKQVQTADIADGAVTSSKIAPGAAANGGAFYENDITINADVTITTGKNAMAAGPITIANGVTVTVPDGSTLTIV